MTKDVHAGSESVSTRVQRIVSQHWPLITLLVCMFAAWPAPNYGAAAYSKVNAVLVPALFLIVGMTLDIRSLSGLLQSGLLHCALWQSYSLLGLPLAYYGLVYHWGWERHTGLVSDVLAPGVMACMCMPTTTNTCILFTQEAHGDSLLAATNAAVGNLLGTIVAPLMAHLLLGNAGKHDDTAAALLKSVLSLVVPLVVGMGLQWLGQRAPELWDRTQRGCKLLFKAMMLVIFYLLFCKVFAGGTHGLDVGKVSLLVLFISGTHLMAVLGAWLLGAHLPMQQRIAFLFVGPQKSEGMAVPIISAIFAADDAGLYMLPVVIYHTVQMVLASALTAPLRNKVQAQAKLCAETGQTDDDDEGVVGHGPSLERSAVDDVENVNRGQCPPIYPPVNAVPSDSELESPLLKSPL